MFHHISSQHDLHRRRRSVLPRSCELAGVKAGVWGAHARIWAQAWAGGWRWLGWIATSAAQAATAGG